MFWNFSIISMDPGLESIFVKKSSNVIKLKFSDAMVKRKSVYTNLLPCKIVFLGNSFPLLYFLFFFFCSLTGTNMCWIFYGPPIELLQLNPTLHWTSLVCTLARAVTIHYLLYRYVSRYLSDDTIRITIFHLVIRVMSC